jgi:general secretion pathway protein C
MDSALFDRLQGQSVWWPRLALALAAAAALWFGLRLLLLALAGPDLPLPPSVARAEFGASVERPTGTVAQWHLFGTAAPGFDPRQLAAVDAPETALRLTLRGTFSDPATDGGIAVIADEQGIDRGYRVGDTLPGDARLEAIYAGRVLLSRGGINESLSLPRAAEMAGARPAASRGRPAPTTPGAMATPGFVNPMISPGAPVIEAQRALGSSIDIEALAREVNVLPVLENGRFAGVRLSVGRDSDLLARYGLRGSDVITAVNGIPLDGPQRQAELLTSLRDARQATLTVRRDGQLLQIPVGF